MPTYSYADCLAHSYKVNWKIEDVLGEKRLDPSKRWLPASLSGASELVCLDADEKRALTQLELGAYAHIFGYVEEFIAPKVSCLAHDFELERRDAFDALTNFAAEEVKHMNLFRAVGSRVNDALGLDLELLSGATDTARFVLSKSGGAVLLFTACIEWMSQRHYLDAWKDDGSLDGLTKDIFKAHWLEESQHAKLDHLETLRAFASMTEAERDQAIDEVIELVAAVDGLLQQQVQHDLSNLSSLLGRSFDAQETAELQSANLSAKRWTFIMSGVTHPRFQELFAEVTTPAQQERVGAALDKLLGADAVAT